MIVLRRHKILLVILTIALPLIAAGHLFAGQIAISLNEYASALFSYDEESTHQIIARQIRFPRMIIAALSGAGLSIAGLLMQTLFNNPLAGPYVLGINSGASLLVALSFMTGIPLLSTELGVVSSAFIGAFLFGVIILVFSYWVKSRISLLLIGLMLGSFTSAIVYILQMASTSEELKAFTMWTMGSLQHVELNQIPLILVVFTIGFGLSLLVVKPLNILVLGEADAKLLGLNFKSVRLVLISITAILTGIITAYCGPIAFVGLAIPNLVRIVLKTQNHLPLLLTTALMGAIFVLFCDICIQLLEAHVHIPINAFTSLLGAPFVVFIVLKRLA